MLLDKDDNNHESRFGHKISFFKIVTPEVRVDTSTDKTYIGLLHGTGKYIDVVSFHLVPDVDFMWPVEGSK